VYDSFESQAVTTNFAFATVVVRLAVAGAPFWERFPVPTTVALMGLTGSTRPSIRLRLRRWGEWNFRPD